MVLAWEEASVSSTTATLVCFVGFYILTLIFLQRSSSKTKLPPGPWGLPALGHLFLVGKDPWRTFLDWKDKYGKIYMISLAGKSVVVLNDAETMQEFFSREEMGRPSNFDFVGECCKIRGGLGVAVSEGKRWKELRSFLHKGLKEFGIQNKHIEESLREECGKLVEDFKNLDKRYVGLSHLFHPYAGNATWRAIGNGELTDHEIHVLLHAQKAGSDYTNPFDAFAIAFPKFVDKFSSRLGWRRQAWATLKEMLQLNTTKHFETRIPGQPRDMIDQFQDITDETTNPESSFHSLSSQMIPFLNDIMFGAVDTTGLTMEWLMLYMLRNPGIQAKMQEEIDNAVGDDRLPELRDRVSMPYTQACIFEALRIRPALPFGIPKRVMADITVAGYSLPENTIVFANILGMQHDPKVWPKPEEYIPERFLDESGLLLPESKKMINSFSKGKRTCPGDTVAYDTLFMLVSSIFQNFTITSQEKNPSVQTRIGMTNVHMVPISVAFIPRK